MQLHRIPQLVGVLVLLAMLAGCTPEKAEALRIAALQFKKESVEAIDAIDAMHAKEVEPPPRTETEANEEFVNNILSTKKPINENIINVALDPYTFEQSAATREAWARFREDLATQYTAFSNIFTRLQQGSILGRESVTRAVPYAEKLTVQMASFAKSVQTAGPIFLQRRTAIIDAIEQTKNNASLSASDKKKQLLILAEKWRALRQEENALQKEVVTKCLQAALLGKEVIKLARDYDKVSIDDINWTISKALELSGQLTGKDYSELSMKAEEIFTAIKSDPVWSVTADEILEDINNARAGQGS